MRRTGFVLGLFFVGACSCARTPAAPPTRSEAMRAAEFARDDFFRLFDGEATFRAVDLSPWAVVVELDAEGRAEAVVPRFHEELNALTSRFVEAMGAPASRLGDSPRVVVVLADSGRYAEYFELRGAPLGSDALAAFEWDAQRLVLAADGDAATRRHEAAHLLISLLSDDATRLAFGDQGFAFHEGLAEWCALGDPDSRSAAPTTELDQLLNLRIGSRVLLGREATRDAYAAARRWIAFLRDPNSGAPPDAFARWTSSELSGRTGRAAAAAALGLDDEGMKALSVRFRAYER